MNLLHQVLLALFVLPVALLLAAEAHAATLSLTCVSRRGLLEANVGLPFPVTNQMGPCSDSALGIGADLVNTRNSAHIEAEVTYDGPNVAYTANLINFDFQITAIAGPDSWPASDSLHLN